MSASQEPDVGLLVWSAFTFGLLLVGGVWWWLSPPSL